MERYSKLPFYAKATYLIVGLTTFFFVLYIARDIIVPIVFSIIIAILLSPLVNFFVKKRVNRLFSIIITLVLTFVVIVSAGGFILSQAMQFAESWPVFIEKFYATITHFIGWISSYFNVEQHFIYEWIAKTKGEITNVGTATIGQLIVSIGSGVVVLLLIPVYVFMILFYESLLLEFVDRLFGKENQVQVRKIVTQIKVVIKRYLIGLVIETILVTTLNTVGLLALGINYAIFLGIIGALLNLIPYVGGVVGVALPMMVALATKSSAWYAIYVLAIYYFIQLIDNNYFVPKIVASKVKLNALFSVITVIVGNALWGISGMFLSIPLLAIVKLIFDHIETLKPWGFLLGNTMTPKIKIKPILKKRKR